MPFTTRLRRWSSKLPLWAIALFLISPVVVLESIPNGRALFPNWFRDFGYFALTYAAVFLPGALTRWKWRHAIFVLAVAGIAYGLQLISTKTHLPYPYSRVSVIPLLIGVGAWWVHPLRQNKLLIQILLLTGSVTLLIATVEPFTDPYFYYNHHTFDIAYASFWLLIALLSWVAISLSSEGKKILTPSLALATSVGWFLLFFLVIVHPLARRSLLRGLPLSRQYSLFIIRQFPDPAGEKTLWEAIASADWSKPDQNEPFDNDYRKGCIDLLSQHNRSTAAASLSGMLRRRPSRTLADFSADTLALEHRYETAPELMRYYSLYPLESERAKDALISMNIPQAALAILWEDVAARKLIEYENETKSSLLELRSTESNLTHLLGKDVGDRWNAWAEFYNSAVANRPTPLTPAQTDEVYRILIATEKYWKAVSSLRRQHRLTEIAQFDLDVPGTAAYEQAINRFAAAAIPASLPAENAE